MKSSFAKLGQFVLKSLFLIALSCSWVRAAVVHKIDDTAVTGDLKSISNGQLTITTKSAPIVIPLDQISQVDVKEIPTPVAATPPVSLAIENQPVVETPNLGGALLGALFGGGHSSTVVTTPVSTPATQPVAVVMPTSAPTSQPAMNQTVQVLLTDGDQFHANLRSWSNQKITLQLPSNTPLQLSSTAFSEIWFGTSQLQSKAKQLTIEPGPEDVALVTKDDDVIAVKGLAQGITGDALRFRFDDQDRKINLGKVIGLLLRSNNPAPITTFHQLIHTDSGDRFSGNLSAIEKGSLVLTSPDRPSLKIPESSITTIDFLNGRMMYLTDLKPIKVEQTPYFGRVIPYQVNQSLTGGPLVLSDGTCPRGIAVHSRCVLQYDVSSGFDRFKTKLGFQQPEGQAGRVLVRVLGDGKVLYENPDARGDQPPIEIDVPLSGVHTLILEIDFGKDQDVGDRVIWANPRLVRGT